MARAVVTGGAGCIGSVLAQRLIASGAQVTVLDNLSSGKREHIQALLSEPTFHFVQGDLLDLELVDRVLKGADIVYHMAANPDVKFRPGDPTDKDLRQNVLATHVLLDAMARHGVGKLVLASTSAVYGLQDQMPIPETAVCRPISLYGASKLSCEALVCAFAHLFGMQAWIVRLANIVGDRVRKRGRTVIGDFIHKLRGTPHRLEILGDGRQAKSYLSTGECIEAIQFLVAHAQEQVNVYNLAAADWLTVTEIADITVEALGLRNVTYAYSGGSGGWPGDVPRFRLDVSRLNALGWRAQRSSAEAVRQAAQAIIQNQYQDEQPPLLTSAAAVSRSPR